MRGSVRRDAALVGGLAVLTGLFGPSVIGWITGRSLPRVGARILLAIAGVTMVVGTPPPLAGWGLSGFVNELLGQAGVAASMGGVSPPFGGLALGLRWVFQFLLLGLFATTVAVRAPPIPAVDARVSPATPASS